MDLRITEEQFERLTSALNIAIGLSLVHAKDSHAAILRIAQELDDAWNDQNYGDGDGDGDGYDDSDG